jgi:hypothetical protein
MFIHLPPPNRPRCPVVEVGDFLRAEGSVVDADVVEFAVEIIRIIAIPMCTKEGIAA